LFSVGAGASADALRSGGTGRARQPTMSGAGLPPPQEQGLVKSVQFLSQRRVLQFRFKVTVTQRKKNHERVSAPRSEIRIDRPAAESWGRIDTSNKLVAAYQLGRLLNCRDWLHVRRTLPRRTADARRQLAKVDARLITLAAAIKGVRQSSRVARAIRESNARFDDWWGSEQYVDWSEYTSDLNKSWDEGTATFKASWVYEPDKPVERALKNNLSRRLLALIALGRLLDEGVRPVRDMKLSDFDLIKAENPVVEATEMDLIWLAAVRARCDGLQRANDQLRQMFETLENGPERTRHPVQSLDERIDAALRLFGADDGGGNASPVPGYLELFVDVTERTIRRKGFDREINLARSDLRWHLFNNAYQARGEHARERCLAGYPGDKGAVRTTICALNENLKGLNVRLYRFRLISCDRAGDR